MFPMHTLTLACGTVVSLQQLEANHLSFVPCGEVNGQDQPLLPYAHLWGKKQRVTRQTYGKTFNPWQLRAMTGVQLMTGYPSSRPAPHSPDGSVYLTDIDIEARFRERYPAIVDRILALYRDACIGTPCILKTKSDGRRLSAFVPALDPKREFKDVDGKMLMEIFSIKGLSRLDARYALLQGSLFDIPSLSKKGLQAIHAIISEVATEHQPTSKDTPGVVRSQLGGLPLTWNSAGRSQYFPAARCQATSHQDSTRATVRFSKWKGGISGHCFNCGETWWEEPPTHTPHKLYKREGAEEAPQPPIETLDTNRAKREAAADTFFGQTAETPHLFLVKDATGTGKTHTLFAKAKQHGKRTLAQLPHSALAQQAVAMAREHGFTDPFHLRGREHNWDKSGIAQIPVSQRTAALFEKNNCIMVDELKTYTDKRIAPRTYCEHQCPFRQNCRHLAQYAGLAQRDFIATCTPNILFDPEMRGYLKAFVSTRENPPTPEDLAIDAMLGTQSKPTQPLDFAILDDYSISALYTDITLAKADFKALKKAWKGTPTADFAQHLLKAFKKKKPRAIVKALRTAFEQLGEKREAVAKALTQHARTGTVAYTEHPKSSQETQRRLSEKVVHYEDGGTQWIPVDFDAYQELITKKIPTVNPHALQTQTVGEKVTVPHTPTHALLAGVPLQKLTPVWQKGATPVDLLAILLASIENDKNTPITRDFRAGTLTFSIPPQAPVGILPQIAMLSATTDSIATKKAFAGQAITFSEHTGHPLEWAEGVQVHQFQDARLTSASIFEYPKNADGKRKRQAAPTRLTPTAEKRLHKLNAWAKTIEGETAFIGHKEFTEHFGETLNGFDSVTHFDKVAGLNFEGLKYLVVFGYPKVKHEGVTEEARKQHAADREPLPKGTYEELTETATYTENNYTITERRYKDPRHEKIRHQLATEKLQQAIGRARLPRWKNTTTLIFTNTPIPDITNRAHLFANAAFTLAKTPSELPAATHSIQNAEESGDVQAVMKTKGVSQRTAQRQTKTKRDQHKANRNADIRQRYHDGHSKKQIATDMHLARDTVHRVLAEKTTHTHSDEKRHGQLVPLIGDGGNRHPPKNPDGPCVDTESAEKPAPLPVAHGHSQKRIAEEMCIGRATGNRSLAEKTTTQLPHEKKVLQKRHGQLVPLIGDGGNVTPPKNTDIPCGDTEVAATPAPLPVAQYSQLTLAEARAELQRCEATYNYNGAAYLRRLLTRRRGLSQTEKHATHPPPLKQTPPDKAPLR